MQHAWHDRDAGGGAHLVPQCTVTARVDAAECAPPTPAPTTSGKVHWSTVLDNVAAVARVPGCTAVALLALAVAALGWGCGGRGVLLGAMLTCGVLAGGAVARCPAFALAHVFVDHSNVAVPLLTRARRLSFAGLRAALLKDPSPPPEWCYMAACAREWGWDDLAGAMVTRQAGTMYVCGSGHAGRAEPRWCASARHAGFKVTQLTRVQKAPGYVGEESVDDVLHKAMSNATLDATMGMGATQSGTSGTTAVGAPTSAASLLLALVLALLARVRTVVRALGLGSLVPRQVLVQVSGDGNDNGGVAGGERGGFPAQVQRALRHGMHAEVWSWAACLSATYRHMAASHSRWAGARLRLVELDTHEAAVSAPAPACRYRDRCTSARCSYSHPRAAPATCGATHDSNGNGNDNGTNGNDNDVRVRAASPALPASSATLLASASDSESDASSTTGDAAAAATTDDGDEPARRRTSARHSPSTVPVAVVVCAGPPDSATKWGRGARAHGPTPSPALVQRYASNFTSMALRLAVHAPPAQAAPAPPSPPSPPTPSPSQSPVAARWTRRTTVCSVELGQGRGHATGGTTDYLTRFDEPCRYGVRCTLRKCGYKHPEGWNRPALLATDRVRATRGGGGGGGGGGGLLTTQAQAQAQAQAGDASAPATGVSAAPAATNSRGGGGFRKSVECRYGTRCTSDTCGFAHPPEWVRPAYMYDDYASVPGPPAHRRSSSYNSRRGGSGSGSRDTRDTRGGSTSPPGFGFGSAARRSHTGHGARCPRGTNTSGFNGHASVQHAGSGSRHAYGPACGSATSWARGTGGMPLSKPASSRVLIHGA